MGDVMAVQPHTLIGGRYRLVRPLGEGGCGVVWEALDEGLAPRANGVPTTRSVAVKLLKLHSTHAERRMQREARITMALRHRGIVSVEEMLACDVGEGVQQIAIVMELLRGKPLSEVLTARRS